MSVGCRVALYNGPAVVVKIAVAHFDGSFSEVAVMMVELSSPFVAVMGTLMVTKILALALAASV